MLRSVDEATQLIKSKALELGFSDVGISSAQELVADSEHFQQWLSNGYQASMSYMERNAEKRVNASLLVEGAQSVISLLVNYYPSVKQNPSAPIVAKYAYGNDYHDVIKPKLQLLYDYIKSEIYPDLDGRLFTDSAPILERAYAVQGGLGWIGKNSNLIHKRLGSFCFIAELVINIPLKYDVAIKDACGGCTRCIDACPTKAIVADRVVDSNRCISFLTIENKGEIDSQFDGQFQNRLFGCDICQDVCPWNWKARATTFEGLEPNLSILSSPAEWWANITLDTFSLSFKGSSIKRAKFSGLVRNLNFLKDKSI